MASNSRLAIAIHTAGMLAAMAESGCVTSEKIAESVSTNSVVIRRIIGSLVKHDLVEVRMGAGGGSSLTRSPEEITLADIYLALEEGSLFQVPVLDQEHECKMGITVRPVIAEVLQEAEDDLIKKLRSITLADVMKRVRTRLIETGCFEEK
ncbi:MAG: Rrf2 family transcriptional regulator [Pyrinomonadaceae bacterium]